MITVEYTEAQLAKGRACLKAMIGKARKYLSETKGWETDGTSPIGKSAIQHVTERNLDALIVYQTVMGWHADVLCKNMPSGVPRIFGTPSGSPFQTKEEAEQAGIIILAYLLLAADKNKITKRTKPLPPVFNLYDIAINLVPEVFSDIQSVLEGLPIRLAGFSDYAEAIQRIEDVLDECFPQLRETNGKKLAIRLKRLPREKLLLLMSVLHRAAMSEILQYPPRTVATASQHREHTTKQ